MAGLSAAVARLDRDEFCRLCDEAKVPAGPILSVDEVLSNEHVLARGMVREFAHPQLGSFKALPVPFKFEGFDDPSLGRPPLLGEHTDQVLGDRLGLGKEDIQALRERKVI